jgi:predicted NodU family carbamoyl transferase
MRRVCSGTESYTSDWSRAIILVRRVLLRINEVKYVKCGFRDQIVRYKSEERLHANIHEKFRTGNSLVLNTSTVG